MSEPLLSLAVIVRDEAAALAGLLETTASLWDECIVVDTGSVDDSVRVAEASGARVIHETWRDDFSRARNRGLEAASGRWILVLDCDERLSGGDLDSIRELAAGPVDRVYNLPQWNYTDRRELPDVRPVRAEYSGLAAGAGIYVEARQIRLFPRRGDLRYSGNIHESIDDTVIRSGLAIIRKDIPVHHYGHLPEYGKDNARKRLYSRLLRTKIAERPEDPLSRYELAVQLANEGHFGLAERLLARTVRDAPGSPGVHRARLLLGRLLAARGDGSGAARQAALAVQERPDQQACWVAAVQQHAAVGDRSGAARYLSAGLQLFPHEPHLNRLKYQDNPSLADV